MYGEILLWIVIGAVAILIDIFTSSFLFIWFTVGSIVALIISGLGYAFSVQFIAFIFTSVILLAIGYPIVKNTIKKSVPKTLPMGENYVNRIITIEKDVKEEELIKIDGIYWTVINKGELIKKGEKAKIIALDGNKFILKKYEEENL
ncbi:NfeD family protein [Clostridium cochlearium]|uniref:Membrane protein implicated in regulation of membrane protease activity n=1 Tax=Clostridium cochlearium TaxID=1494 RepID=A0A1G9FED7_CLOCO|nr:NfeD family protein [Clostridium cochlearium]MBU5269188.1 NfeD family protein [Clostridium cochlearium]MCR1971477.1 NfeD family protein [Clostridium cochlearium]SDK86573.1 Membrane protein implicated in regulation of membrane protease activity [Clostridium cochlearium]SQB36170.1 membrane protein implicated in regulation of membrane protease activity [Clostridium cochlearium]